MHHEPDDVRPASEPARPEASDTAVRVIDRRWWARADQGDSAPDGARVSDKPSYVQELEARLDAKDAELRETLTRYREASDSFDEMRVRIRRDAARDAERSRRQVLIDWIEVVDNLDRAIEAATQTTDADGLRQGVELIRQQSLAKLGAHGVTRVVSLGRPFDPTVHEAATTVPVSSAAQDGVVVGVIREGYAVGADTLRPALVAVGQRRELV